MEMIDVNRPLRVVIENIQPSVCNARFAAKVVIGDIVEITSDIYTHGHDSLAAVVEYRHKEDAQWQQVAMKHWNNDCWTCSFHARLLGIYVFRISAWVNDYGTWQSALKKKWESGQDVGVDLEIGGQLLNEAAERASGADKIDLSRQAREIQDPVIPASERIELSLRSDIIVLASRYPADNTVNRSSEHRVVVSSPEARFSSWYEAFPRSWSGTPGVHGTFKDCEDSLLPYVAEMGFDVLYFPPIHPIGFTCRKGRNNSRVSSPGEPGSPWAIGNDSGGFKTVHPELGNLEDFRSLLEKASHFGIQIAMDIALQCSADHPYLREHPKWFKWRPDGTVQYAENPPKKYEDIYPLDFESDDWRSLWEEIRTIFFFWAEQGVRIFRVDNPHTKPFAFWEWLIAAVKNKYPSTLFLSEAFTRPKVMYQLAKLGFDQSYTYFTWRNSKNEITTYFKEITDPSVKHFFRPNLWPNTPDILSPYLQTGGRPAFIARLILAATLSPSYGIYGPAFELMENTPRQPMSEEYYDSEKYQLRYWDIDKQASLKSMISAVNSIRRANKALQHDSPPSFHLIDNDALIAYSRISPDGKNIIICVINLDPHNTQSGFLDLPLNDFGISASEPFIVKDLLNDEVYEWVGPRSYIELNTGKVGHILTLQNAKNIPVNPEVING